MRIGTWAIGVLTSLAVGFGAVPAQAEVLTFRAKLDGKYGAATGSAATGTARVKVDTRRRRLSVDLTLDGITADALWDKLVTAPIGPIHFHKYATAAGGDSVLVLPLPYGAQYRATKHGLRVTMKDYDYVAGGKLVKSNLSFDEFVVAMRSGLVVLNVHTDAFNPGEISGLVTEG
jgi:CHRD domain